MLTRLMSIGYNNLIHQGFQFELILYLKTNEQTYTVSKHIITIVFFVYYSSNVYLSTLLVNLQMIQLTYPEIRKTHNIVQTTKLNCTQNNIEIGFHLKRSNDYINQNLTAIFIRPFMCLFSQLRTRIIGRHGIVQY